LSLVAANSPISNIQVTLRGKKYDIQDVTTVSELQERLSDASGVDPSLQGRILFNGKRLDASDSLSTAGVAEGDQLNVVPKAKKKSSSSSTSAAAAASSKSAASAATVASPPSTSSAMKDILAGAGMDSSTLDDLVKSMGGAGEAGAPSMAESMEMMTDMMNSPIFKEYMSDPDKLEESRQMILNNPMLKSMMGGMPGMEDLLNSPEAWKEAMQAAASLYQNMDQDDLMQAMMGGASGMPPPGAGGLFDGMNNAQPELAALDELSEGED
jgi:hypothetical protein